MGDIDLVQALAFCVVFVLSTTVHEAAHAWVGWKLGDDTAYRGGQVSLDPTPHIRREPWGMVVLPLLTVFRFGWPLGFASAPYDPEWAHRWPRRSALMALAGPASNLALFLLAAAGLRAGLEVGWFEPPASQGDFARIVDPTGGSFGNAAAMLLSMFFVENLVLAAFNLLPLPPLDGSGGVQLFLPTDVSRRYTEFLRQPSASLIGLLAAWFLFAPLFEPVFVGAINLLFTGITSYG